MLDAPRERPRDDRREPSREGGLRSAPCPRCGVTTTHTGDACTSCLRRAENRKNGALWLALAAPLLFSGLWGLSTVPGWPPPSNHRGSFGLALLLVLGGVALGARGLRGVVLGRSPDEG